MRLLLLVCLILSIGIVRSAKPSPNVVNGLVDGFRPPATPLVVSDPYFSIWSACNNLTDCFPTFWGGQIIAFVAMVNVDGDVYRLMGTDTFTPSGQDQVPPLQQISQQVFPTQTVYTFGQSDYQINLTFTTPQIPTDLDLFSRPVTYLTYTFTSSSTHHVQFYFHNTAEVSVNSVSEQVEWSRTAVQVPDATVMRVGTLDQPIFQTQGDDVKINWGYFYLTLPNITDVGLTTVMTAWNVAANSFANQTPFPGDEEGPRECQDDWPVLAAWWDLGTVGGGDEVSSVYTLLAYDDIYSMWYFGTPLPPYWRRNADDSNQIVSDMLETAINEYLDLKQRCNDMDTELIGAFNEIGGPKYATMMSLIHRQVFGAMKITYQPELDTAWAFIKEISSAGDISTVDVIAPASPMLLFFSPELLRILLLPQLYYANNQTNIPYNLAWAPHHLGLWPVANITPAEQEQMPVEETGNMMLMLTAIAQSQDGDVGYLYDEYFDLLQGWGQFLISNLPNPPNQLCTDDFEGPEPQNVNLAAKGIVGLAAYSILLDMFGETEESQKYEAIAQNYTQYWTTNAYESQDSEFLQHYKRQYNLTGTWSIKYNLLFDRLLKTNLFPAEVFNTEMQFYASQTQPYGVPLDDRNDYTLLEYQGVIIGFNNYITTNISINGEVVDYAQVLIDAMYLLGDTTPQRVPMTDWYYCANGTQIGFQARPTLGELYTPLLIKTWNPQD
eukprot:TRINITY_DN6218_c0_g1_i1.p1 TRINITY_DN6218_c0_g1~~TRINITY_DN6218_c0_g1_i1.p1  ORF type:complete len:723 (+),score=122.71 TRINITY_DN6218_c0_g1_i1:68-2236(+)